MAKKKSMQLQVVPDEKFDTQTFFEGVTNARRQDGWINGITGLGTDRDARKYSRMSWTPITEMDAEILYAGEPMARKVVDLPVDHAMQKGFEITGIDKEDQSRLIEAGKKLDIVNKVRDAMKQARLFGGAGLMKIYDDDLRIGLPKQEGRPLRRLIILHKYEIRAEYEDLERSMLSKNFGLPRVYTLNPRGSRTEIGMSLTKIHGSRILRFEGVPLTTGLRASAGYWGDSVLTALEESIRNYADAHNAGSSAAKDMSVAVFKIRGLANIVNAEQEMQLLRRMEMVNITKANARAVVIDADGEEFDFKARNLTGASDLISKAEARLSGDSDIPRTVLFGEQSAGGLGSGASGEHSSENWYNRLSTIQENEIKPALLDLYKELALELNIDTEKMDIEFNPSWSMSDKDEVQMRKSVAETDKIYMDMGVLSSEEIRESRFGGDKYSIETTIDPLKEIALAGAGIPGFGGSPMDPASDPAPTGLPAGETPTDTAMNGAQVSSLVEVAQAALSKQIPRDSAAAILRTAFPTISAERIEEILGDPNAVVVPPPAPKPFGG